MAKRTRLSNDTLPMDDVSEVMNPGMEVPETLPGPSEPMGPEEVLEEVRSAPAEVCEALAKAYELIYDTLEYVKTSGMEEKMASDITDCLKDALLKVKEAEISLT